MSAASELGIVPAVWLDHARRAIKAVPPGLDRGGWNCSSSPWLRQRFDLASIATAIAFIQAGPCCRVSVPRLSSYALKHGAERWGARVGLSSYIMNGDFILAALYCNVLLGAPSGTNCAVGLRYEKGA